MQAIVNHSLLRWIPIRLSFYQKMVPLHNNLHCNFRKPQCLQLAVYVQTNCIIPCLFWTHWELTSLYQSLSLLPVLEERTWMAFASVLLSTAAFSTSPPVSCCPFNARSFGVVTLCYKDLIECPVDRAALSVRGLQDYNWRANISG